MIKRVILSHLSDYIKYAFGISECNPGISRTEFWDFRNPATRISQSRNWKRPISYIGFPIKNWEKSNRSPSDNLFLHFCILRLQFKCTELIQWLWIHVALFIYQASKNVNSESLSHILNETINDEKLRTIPFAIRKNNQYIPKVFFPTFRQCMK